MFFYLHFCHFLLCKNPNINVCKNRKGSIRNPHIATTQCQQLTTYSQSCLIYILSSSQPLHYFEVNPRHQIFLYVSLKDKNLFKNISIIITTNKIRGYSLLSLNIQSVLKFQLSLFFLKLAYLNHELKSTFVLGCIRFL